MAEIKLYNTLTRKKETFKPIKKGAVSLYSCGPTVYWYQHIGNLRTYIFSDILKRVLLYNDYKVKHVMNVTDVGHLTSDADDGEDKIEKAALKEGRTAQEIADYYLKFFQEDLEKINVLAPNYWTKATEHIKEQIDLIKKLEKKGYTYKTSDGIYFDSTKFKNYGKLARLNVKGLKAGKRISVGEKKAKTDFALWKFSESPGKRQQEWESPWGIGFPGWHIECSAMSMKYLGEHFDIHTGGEDHISIHHTNEIAQSEAATGKKFVNYWLHGAFLVHKGEKVSKSKGGLYTISELEEIGYKSLDYRYLCLLTHYRKPLDFSIENLDAAKKAFERMKRKIVDLKNHDHKGSDKSGRYLVSFTSAINDDLNMPRVIQIVWKMLDDLTFNTKKKLKLLESFDKVLGLDMTKINENSEVPEHIWSLVNERDELRAQKKFEEADIIRERVHHEGYEIEDTPEGARVLKI